VKIRPLLVKTIHFGLQLFAPVLLFCLCPPFLLVVGAGSRVPIVLQPDDVVPTGSQWISLPDIHSVDGAVGTFNAISMRNRGLLQVTGENGGPVLEPCFMADRRPLRFRNPSKCFAPADGTEGSSPKA
jgi:hypothetical protein